MNKNAFIGLLTVVISLSVFFQDAVRGDDLEKSRKGGDRDGAVAAKKATTDEGLGLLRKGDEQADRGDTTSAVVSYKEGFERILPVMRGLPFRHEVKRDVTLREKLAEMLIKEIDSETPPEEFRADELGMKALGLLPADYKLKDSLVKLYTEQIAAFYDPKTKTMHLIQEPGAKAFEKTAKPSFLDLLMGKTSKFNKDENKTVIAHELTHALADQHYDLDLLQKATHDDDDASTALSALIEGEATLTMMGAQTSDWTGERIVNLPHERLKRTFELMGPMMIGVGGGSLASAPPILSEGLLFPYLRGVVFCAKLANDGGWAAIDRAYKRPPLSTEQIIHPEKYDQNIDVPMAVDLGDLPVGGDWKELGRNVVGEMQLAVMLRKQNGKSAAAGWDGDSYAVFEAPDGRLGLVWLSVWDSDSEAIEFHRAYARFQTSKLAKEAVEPDAFPDSIRRPDRGAVQILERRGPLVCVVEGFSADAANRIVEAAFKAKIVEKTPETLKTKKKKGK